MFYIHDVDLWLWQWTEISKGKMSLTDSAFFSFFCIAISALCRLALSIFLSVFPINRIIENKLYHILLENRSCLNKCTPNFFQHFRLVNVLKECTFEYIDSYKYKNLTAMSTSKILSYQLQIYWKIDETTHFISMIPPLRFQFSRRRKWKKIKIGIFRMEKVNGNTCSYFQNGLKSLQNIITPIP